MLKNSKVVLFVTLKFGQAGNFWTLLHIYFYKNTMLDTIWRQPNLYHLLIRHLLFTHLHPGLPSVITHSAVPSKISCAFLVLRMNETFLEAYQTQYST